MPVRSIVGIDRAARGFKSGHYLQGHPDLRRGQSTSRENQGKIPPPSLARTVNRDRAIMEVSHG
jgi:hypothetical protein